jgi:hypothetical protein
VSYKVILCSFSCIRTFAFVWLEYHTVLVHCLLFYPSSSCLCCMLTLCKAMRNSADFLPLSGLRTTHPRLLGRLGCLKGAKSLQSHPPPPQRKRLVSISLVTSQTLALPLTAGKLAPALTPSPPAGKLTPVPTPSPPRVNVSLAHLSNLWMNIRMTEQIT